MNIKFLPLLALSAFAGMEATAQELTSKIPAHADFVVSINNKAIVEQSSMELLNETLTKLGAFEQAKNMDFPIKNLKELDFNLDKQAYVYRANTDSLHYIGILLPLKANHQVKQHMFPQYEVLPIYNGYERRVSKDGKTQVAWNSETMFILTGDVHSQYFQMKDVADRYGLDLGSYATDTWTYNEALGDAATAATAAAEEAVEAMEEETFESEEEILPDTVNVLEEISEAEMEAVEAVVDSTIAISADQWDDSVDTVEAYDLESDSLYLLNQAREAKNDSIKNKLFGTWLANDFNGYLDPKSNMANNKAIKLTDNKHLIRLWVPNVDKLYQGALPYDVLKLAYGIDMDKFKYGYEEGTFDLIQDQHTIKFTGTLGVDAEMAKIFKPLYNGKINKKFAKYIPENHLAYAAVNINTEAYLKQLPALVNRWYAPIAGEYSDVVTIGATALEIALDEKAIGKVMKGDHAFFLNDLQKVNKEYVTYEYDDDYNYKEITKMKDEYVPNFLWMFTSQDQRLYKRTLDFAVKKQEVTLENGIYKIAEQKNIKPIYILFKEDLVFVGSDVEQLTSIEQNRFKGTKNAKVKKDLLANPFNLVVHANAIPEVVHKLEVPVTASLQQTMKDLSTYGDIQLKGSTLKNRQFSGELSIELPKEDKNALQYILKHIMQNMDSKIAN
ncbi:hypothetical protein ABE545_10435 [Sphingobacterium faecium]|uniref:hypothetical protein n=1 Tax=Sphingobacterium faecium TaxID=34087 RepID=UPI00320A1AA3